MIYLKIKKYCFIFFILGTLFSCKKTDSHPDNNEKLLRILDDKIKNKKYYEIKKKNHIQKLKKEALLYKNNDSITYHLNNLIVEEYLGYQCDSAYIYSDKNKKIAIRNNNEIWLYKNLLQRSVLLSTTGLFVESKEILDHINPEALPSTLRFSYNSAYECLYSNLSDYSGGDSPYNKIYKNKLADYYNSAYKALKPGDPFYYLFLSHKNRVENNWSQAEQNVNKFLKTTHPGTRLHAIGSFCKAVIDAKLGNIDSQESCLIYSAISDIESSTKENRSMQDLASILYQKGETDRAYKYIQSSLEDANFYNARFRNIQISKVQPIIEETYLQTINTQNKQLRWSIFLISILFAGLGITMYFIYKQLKMIAKSRNELSNTNSVLKSLNNKLDEANHIKEEYIAFFIRQNSNYLEKFERYKKLISIRLSTGQLDKLSAMVNDKKNEEMDLNELYHNFDQAFLRIYPNFVNEVNKLLKKEEVYNLKEGTLNTELRIFALIRLGINDTNQISEFLRYSLRTIYNYRSKVKAKSVIENDEFEAKIMQIGSIITS
jgi:hypothetical protein